MLNRAPTAHRLGIQAFEPVLVEAARGCIRCLCTRSMRTSTATRWRNSFRCPRKRRQRPASSCSRPTTSCVRRTTKPVTVPTQDMILGTYYLTLPALYDVDAFDTIRIGHPLLECGRLPYESHRPEYLG